MMWAAVGGTCNRTRICSCGCSVCGNAVMADDVAHLLLRGGVGCVRRPSGDRVSLRIADADRKYFSLEALRALAGRQVEVRGWLVWRDPARGRGHPPWMMQLRHPASLAPDA